MSDSMCKEVVENLKSKHAHKYVIYSAQLLYAGSLWMKGNLCVPDAPPPPIVKLVAQMGALPRTQQQILVQD